MAEGGPSGSGGAPIIIDNDNINLHIELVGIVNKREVRHHKH